MGTFVPLTDVGPRVETVTGAQAKADAAEAAAKEHAGTLAYGTNLEATDATVGAFFQDELSTTRQEAGQVFQRRNVPPVAPSLSPITERIEPLRLAVIQEPGAVYATYSRVGEVPKLEKSADGGTSWTVLSTMPGVPKSVTKLTSGTLLAIEETGTLTVGGSNPRVWRSADDGATWAEVPAGLKFPPLSTQGVCEGTDGSVLVAEYGNVAPHQYRIMRSTDDGLTWAAVLTSSGTEPAGDPGHFHSVTYDPVAGKHVAYMDRPVNPGVSGPRIYASSDNGATWQLLAESVNADQPNFVSPMYFADYIAWGSDNEINGRISRIRRDDFYAGRFHLAETVAQLSQKALYFTFPLRPDVWAVSMAGEHINSTAQDGEPGSTMNEIWVVSGNGAVVSGGLESYRVTTAPGELSRVRASFPSYRFDRTDHGGFGWVNTPVGVPRAYAAVPFTQGWEPANKRIDVRAIPYLPPRVAFDLLRSSDPTDVVRFLEYIGTYVALTNDKAPAAVRSEVRFTDAGPIEFRHGGSLRASFNGRINVQGQLLMASNGVSIFAGSGSPEGVVTSPPGSLYLSWQGGRAITVWIKESGTGNTGWSAVGHPSGPTTARPTAPTVGMHFYDVSLGKPIWWNGTVWRDAMGTQV